MNNSKLLARGEEIARAEMQDGASYQWAWGDWANDVASSRGKGRSDRRLSDLRDKLVDRGLEVPTVTTLSTYRRVSAAWPQEMRALLGFKVAHILCAQTDRFDLARDGISIEDARQLVNQRNIDAVAAIEYIKQFEGGEITDLPMEKITLDEEILPRHTRQKLVEEYAEQNLKLFPPVSVFQIDGDLFLADGLHRYEANLLQGNTVIRAEIFVGSKIDARRHAVRANNNHGIRFTEEENLANYEREREANPGASEEYICQILGINRSTKNDYIRAAKVAEFFGPEKIEKYKLNHTKMRAMAQNGLAKHWEALAKAQLRKGWSAKDLELANRNLADNTVPVMFKDRLLAGAVDPLHYDRKGNVVTPIEYLADPMFAEAFIETNDSVRSALAKAFSNRDGQQRDKARRDAKENAPDLLNESDWLNAIGQLSSARYKLVAAINLFRAIETVDEGMRAQVREELHTIGIASDFLQSWATGTARSLDEELQAILNEGN